MGRGQYGEGEAGGEAAGREEAAGGRAGGCSGGGEGVQGGPASLVQAGPGHSPGREDDTRISRRLLGEQRGRRLAPVPGHILAWQYHICISIIIKFFYWKTSL